MANPENLKGHEFTSDQNREEAAKNGRKGGRASGEARRRRKAFAEAFEVLLQREFTDRNGNQLTGVDAIAARTFQAAMDGDLKAMQIIRDTCGEMPVQRIEAVTIPQEVYDRVASILDTADADTHTDVQPTSEEEE